MTSKTTYECDECKQPIDSDLGPIVLTVDLPVWSSRQHADLCGVDCAAKWIMNIPNRLS